MMGLLGIAERELRKFFHSPLLLIVALVGPLLQLVLMGNAFGGKVVHCPVGIVDHDQGSRSVSLRIALRALEANAGTLRLTEVESESAARRDVASGRLRAALIVPAGFSARSLKGDAPRLGLVVDNSDAFVSGALGEKLQETVDALNRTAFADRLPGQVVLDTVEVFPYIRYVKFLLPGIIALSVFLSVMFGGGMLYNDDRMRGVHEGFLVTPIRSIDMVGGMVLAGTLKATLCSMLVAILGSGLAGINLLLHPAALLGMIPMTLSAGFAFNALLFLMMGRIDDPMTPKVLAGILNTVLFFPSGAIYPVEAFPGWLLLLSRINPMTYAVHGLRSLLLRHGGTGAVAMDILILLAIGAVALFLAARTFRRTL